MVGVCVPVVTGEPQAVAIGLIIMNKAMNLIPGFISVPH
jgi:hypothetical protein